MQNVLKRRCILLKNYVKYIYAFGLFPHYVNLNFYIQQSRIATLRLFGRILSFQVFLSKSYVLKHSESVDMHIHLPSLLVLVSGLV